MSFTSLVDQPEIEQIRILAAQLQARGYLAKFTVRDAGPLNSPHTIYDACASGPFTVSMFHDQLKGLDGVYATVDDIYNKIWLLRIDDYRRASIEVRPPSTEQCQKRKADLIARMGQAKYIERYGEDKDPLTNYPKYEWKCPKCETWGSGIRDSLRYGTNVLHNDICQGCPLNGRLSSTFFSRYIQADTSSFYIYTSTGGSYAEITPLGTVIIPGCERYLEVPQTKEFLDRYRCTPLR